MTARPHRILVVDDDSGIRDLLCALFVYEGYTVDTACDGLEGLIRAEACRPNVVILDYAMPRCNGAEFAVRYRLQQDRAPVILLTATDSAAARCREIDADACLRKPFDIDDLLDAVAQRCLAHTGAPRSSGSWGPAPSPMRSGPTPRPSSALREVTQPPFGSRPGVTQSRRGHGSAGPRAALFHYRWPAPLGGIGEADGRWGAAVGAIGGAGAALVAPSRKYTRCPPGADSKTRRASCKIALGKRRTSSASWAPNEKCTRAIPE